MLSCCVEGWVIIYYEILGNKGSPIIFYLNMISYVTKLSLDMECTPSFYKIKILDLFFIVLFGK